MRFCFSDDEIEAITHAIAQPWPDHVRDEALSCAQLALVEAVHWFDPTRVPGTNPKPVIVWKARNLTVDKMRRLDPSAATSYVDEAGTRHRVYRRAASLDETHELGDADVTLTGLLVDAASAAEFTRLEDEQALLALVDTVRRSLPDAYGEVIDLWLFAGWSQADVAAHLDVTASRVNQMVSRIRTRARDIGHTNGLLAA